MPRLKSRSGQIVIPALFLLPTLVLFVYLIFDTAKLSQQKIRHQFALDAAAFVEMTNYSDFLNRTAYVNGAFPMRIFWEGFHDTKIDCEGKTDHCNPETLWQILYDDGDFPSDPNDPGGGQYSAAASGGSRWNIEFSQKSLIGPDKNSGPPELKETLELITKDDANNYWINWNDDPKNPGDAQSIYQLYVQIYQLLGSVEQAQYSVLKRLYTGHNFLKKSYWLNLGMPAGGASAGADAASSLDAQLHFSAQPYCYQKMMFYGNKATGSAFQPWQVFGVDPPGQDLSKTNSIDSCNPGPGLFHLMYVPSDVISGLRSGYDFAQHWEPPGNYFNVNFGQSLLHAKVAIGAGSNAAAVWPYPTPKFQVRQFP